MLSRLSLVRDGYVELLARHRWDWFVTLTFRPSHWVGAGVHPEAADKAFRVFVSKLNRHLFGVRWYRNPNRQIYWARGQEFHRSGKIHFHAVFGSPRGDLNQEVRRLDWMDVWFKLYGIARIEKPVDQSDVLGYLSKYVVKDGEVDLSPNFGHVASGRLALMGSPVPARVRPVSSGVAMRTEG